MSSETLGLVGIALWVMVMIAQMRRKRAAGNTKISQSRRSRLRDHRP